MNQVSEADLKPYATESTRRLDRWPSVSALQSKPELSRPAEFRTVSSMLCAFQMTYVCQDQIVTKPKLTSTT